MITADHNRAELPAMTKLRADTSWYLSEKAGRDLTQTAGGRAQIELAMSEIILAGWGAWQDTQARLAAMDAEAPGSSKAQMHEPSFK